jgi:hypothetical protein
MFDDTCYFIACQSQSEAELICELLNSEPGRSFYNSLIFWDAKRPVTAEILRQLDLHKLAKEIGLGDRLRQYESSRLPPLLTNSGDQCRDLEGGLWHIR